jgi:hypothetical protein
VNVIRELSGATHNTVFFRGAPRCAPQAGGPAGSHLPSVAFPRETDLGKHLSLGARTAVVNAGLPKVMRMKIALLVKSSSMAGVGYEVVFKNINGKITIKCNCPSGEFKKLCKHKLALIRGDFTILMHGYEDYNVLTVKEWINNSPFSQLIIEHDLAENALAEKKKELKNIKDKIEIAMRKGI